MKPMKAADLKQATVEELLAKEKELAEQLFALRLQKVVGQLENPAKIPSVRRDLARVLTVLGDKRREAKQAKA
jgi:large subunit ribosomal protein L29